MGSIMTSEIPLTNEIYQSDGQPRTRWGGAAATLLRKGATLTLTLTLYVTLLLPAVAQVEESTDHLPVYTLTFATPLGQPFLKDKKTGGKFSIPMGDVVKVCVPNYKPKSYSVSAERSGEFDITVKVLVNSYPHEFGVSPHDVPHTCTHAYTIRIFVIVGSCSLARVLGPHPS